MSSFFAVCTSVSFIAAECGAFLSRIQILCEEVRSTLESATTDGGREGTSMAWVNECNVPCGIAGCECAAIKVDSPFDVSKFQSREILRYSVYNIPLETTPPLVSRWFRACKLFPQRALSCARVATGKRLRKAFAQVFRNAEHYANRQGANTTRRLRLPRVDRFGNNRSPPRDKGVVQDFILSNFTGKLKHSLSFAR